MAFLPADPVVLAGIVIAVVGTILLFVTEWPKAYGLIVLIVAMFGLQVVTDFDARTTLGLGLTTPGVLEAGFWWTPLTYMYLHAPGFRHLAGNLIILIGVGPALEERLGARRFLVIYFAAGLFAAVAHVGLDVWGVIPSAPAVGASGAIFGILTVFAMRYPRERIPVWLFFLWWIPSYAVLLIFLGFNLLLMVMPGTGIAWWGHFAGFIVGLVAAEYLRVRGVQLPGAPQKLPDVDALRPLARDAESREYLDKAAQFDGTDKNDAEFALAWVDKFIARTACPTHGTPLEKVVERKRRVARCPEGDVEVAF